MVRLEEVSRLFPGSLYDEKVALVRNILIKELQSRFEVMVVVLEVREAEAAVYD